MKKENSNTDTVNNIKITKCPDYDPGERKPKSKSKFYGTINVSKISRKRKYKALKAKHEINKMLGN